MILLQWWGNHVEREIVLRRPISPFFLQFTVLQFCREKVFWFNNYKSKFYYFFPWWIHTLFEQRMYGSTVQTGTIKTGTNLGWFGGSTTVLISASLERFGEKHRLKWNTTPRGSDGRVSNHGSPTHQRYPPAFCLTPINKNFVNTLVYGKEGGES